MQSRLHIDDYFAEKPIYFGGQVKAYFQMFIYKLGTCRTISRFAYARARHVIFEMPAAKSTWKTLYIGCFDL